jgi:beta-lactamase class A
VSGPYIEHRSRLVFRLLGLLLLAVAAIAFTALIRSTRPAAQAASDGPTGTHDRSPPNKSIAADGIEQRLLGDLDGLQGAYGIAVVDIPTGTVYGINGNRLFRAASVNKMPIVITLYQQATLGKISLGQQVQIDDADIQRYGTGTIQNSDSPRAYSLAQLGELMITVSDNTAAFVLERYLGQQNVQQNVRRWRLDNTSMADNTSTPADSALLMSQLYKGALLPSESTKTILASLQASVFPARIGSGIPSGTAVAHKVGTDVGVFNDAGVVLLNNRPYAMAVLSEDADQTEADAAYARLSRDVYDFEASLITSP